MIFHLLMHNVKLMKDLLYEELGREGIFSGQGRTLAALKCHGKLSQIELARGLNIKRSTLTRMIKQMEIAGMIERTPDKSDSRVINVALTEKGEYLACKVESIWNKFEREFKEVLNEKEYSDIHLGLEKILIHLGGEKPIFKEERKAR